eukprot:2291206-Pyramimonas_sp.AAC.1
MDLASTAASAKVASPTSSVSDWESFTHGSGIGLPRISIMTPCSRIPLAYFRTSLDPGPSTLDPGH